MKNKKLIITVVALAVVLGLLLGIYFATRPDTNADSKSFTMSIVHSDGTSKDLTISSSEEFLAPALIAEKIITDEGIESGMYFTVDGETASWEENQSYWALYIGEDYAMTGMNDTPIEDGGVYKLVYTIG